MATRNYTLKLKRNERLLFENLQASLKYVLYAIENAPMPSKAIYTIIAAAIKLHFEDVNGSAEQNIEPNI